MFEKYMDISAKVANKMPKRSPFMVLSLMGIMALCAIPTIIFTNLISVIVSLVLLTALIPLMSSTAINSQNYKYQSYDYRRICPPTMLFYCFINPKTGEQVTDWSMLEMNESFDRNWYNNYLKPKCVDKGWCRVEMGGMTEEQKKAKQRINKIEKII